MDCEHPSTSVDFQVLLPAHEAELAEVLHVLCLGQGLNCEISKNPTAVAWRIPGSLAIYFSDATGFAIDVSQCKLRGVPDFVRLWEQAKLSAAMLGCEVDKTWLRGGGVCRAWRREDIRKLFDGMTPLIEYIRRMERCDSGGG